LNSWPHACPVGNSTTCSTLPALLGRGFFKTHEPRGHCVKWKKPDMERYGMIALMQVFKVDHVWAKWLYVCNPNNPEGGSRRISCTLSWTNHFFNSLRDKKSLVLFSNFSIVVPAFILAHRIH
jgi:hypothetical protein